MSDARRDRERSFPPPHEPDVKEDRVVRSLTTSLRLRRTRSRLLTSSLLFPALVLDE